MGLRIREPLSGHRGGTAWKTAVGRRLAAILLLTFLACTGAQSSGPIHKVAVGSLGDGGGARAIRERIVEQLKRSGRIQIVEDPASADAVVHGTSSIWATGAVVIDPRSHSSRQMNYQGYLSLELAGRDNQSLWSYLVTPSRFRSGSITNDLADHAASRLLNALETGVLGTPVAASAGSATRVALRASGATLPAPLYLKWFESSGIPVSYDAVGSELGMEQLAEGKVDFAASDMPLQEEGPTAKLRATQIPTVLGAVVPIYNLPGLGRDLDLTPEALAGIYAGKIRKWNDPVLRSSNHGAHLPNADIVVVHRSDGSGTTFVWTSFLSETSPEWKASAGAGVRVAWPVGSGAEGSKGMAELVKKTPNAIGYVELIYAVQHQLEYAAVRNPGGRFIKADLPSITAAASGSAMRNEHDAGLSILNSQNKAAYPISTFTWILVPQDGLDPQKKTAIADLLNWMLTNGQKQCSFLGYPPLPRDVAARAVETAAEWKSGRN